jgi:hypothetical protein
MSPLAIKILVEDPFYVDMATRLFLSLINLLCKNLENLFVKVMSAEVCSTYLCQTFVLKLVIIFALILRQMFDIYVFVMLIWVV